MNSLVDNIDCKEFNDMLDYNECYDDNYRKYSKQKIYPFDDRPQYVDD